MTLTVTDIFVIALGCSLAGLMAGTVGGVVVGLTAHACHMLFPPRPPEYRKPPER
jgi:hypothetical protein